VGRTGRFGRLGVAVNIMASDEDVAKVQEISDKLNIEMDSFDNNDIDKIID
jgi:superfamily II DNA/RNA helicase